MHFMWFYFLLSAGPIWAHSSVPGVETFFHKLQSLKAAFKQEYKGKTYTGCVFLKKPGLLKVDFDEEKVPLIICKKDQCTFYNKFYGNKKVTSLSNNAWASFLLNDPKEIKLKQVVCPQGLGKKRCFVWEKAQGVFLLLATKNNEFVGFYVQEGHTGMEVILDDIHYNIPLKESDFEFEGPLCS